LDKSANEFQVRAQQLMAAANEAKISRDKALTFFNIFVCLVA